MKKLFVFFAGATAVLATPTLVFAEWTPLITSALFDGIKTDVLTATAGIISIVLIVVGAGILIRMLMR